MQSILIGFVLAIVQSTGSFHGQVTDPSGRAVPGATISVSGGSSAKSDGLGQYQVPNLNAGNYTVRASAKGFAPFLLENYQVAAGSAQTLDIALVLAVNSEQVTVTDTAHVDLDPSNNANALVLRGADLDALSDDPDDLATDLQALAGPAAGPNGGDIFIDGFTGGRLPPKQSIREIRVNQNPFAAQFDRPGQGRVEIFTKPGSDDFHGQLQFRFSDAAFNSRNPFVTVKPPYQRRQIEGEFSGPLNKKTSFFVDFERRDTSENAFLNGFMLDPGLNIVPFSGAVVTPLVGIEANFRVDRQLSTNHTLTLRYGVNRDTNDNQGVGGFSLATRAYNTQDNEDTWQAAETAVLNIHTVNEARFRYRRQRTTETGAAAGPTINVQDSFTGGGPALSLSFTHQDRYEAQDFVSIVHGLHTVRFGGILRAVSLTDQDTGNYPGTFTFTSIAAYQTTMLGLRNNWTAAQIRAAGGGASQFSITGGNPLAALKQFDVGFFAQDDWKVHPNFTLSAGLRYETQSHSADRKDFGPRLGFAWGIGKPTAKAPKMVVRGGFGMFYDRLSESLSLSALRLDGIHQQQFVIAAPDFYPGVPTIESLNVAAQPQAIRRIDAGWRAPVMLQTAIGIERQLPRNITVSSNYLHSRGLHQLRSRNVNAPLPVGVGPYGGVNDIYLYETSGVFNQNQLIHSVNARVNAKVSLTGSYVLGYANSDTDGAGTFPSNSYDLSSEYGRAGFDVRHRVQMNGRIALPWGIGLNPFLTITSGRPYNITVGRDLNGDSLYTDRPAFATDLTRASVIRTRLGAFDTAPLPGMLIIPRNFGEGPGLINTQLRLSKSITLKEAKSGGDPQALTFSVNARNVLNHSNYASPSGNLSSPLFGHSTAVVGGNAGGVRRLDLGVRFDF